MTNRLTDTLQLTRRGVISLIGAGGKTSLMFRLAKDLVDSGKTVLTTTTTKIFIPQKKDSPHIIIADSIDKLIEESKARLQHCPHFSAASYHDATTGKLAGFTLDIIHQLWRAAIFDWIIVEADGAKRKPLKATGPHEPVIPDVTSHLVIVTGLDAVGTTLDDHHVHRAELFSHHTGTPINGIITEQSIAKSIATEVKKAAYFNPGASNFVFLNKADTKKRRTSGQKIAGLLQTNLIIDKIITASLQDISPVKKCFDTKKMR